MHNLILKIREHKSFFFNYQFIAFITLNKIFCKIF